MTPLEEAIGEAAEALRDVSARFALVGGLAVSVRAEPRFTRDVDMAVAAEDDDRAEEIVRELRTRGFSLGSSLEQTATGRLSTVRLVTPARIGVVLDLLFASSGIEPEVVGAAEILEIADGLVLPVAIAEHLVALKILSRDDRTRPQDLADVLAIVRHQPQIDLRIVRESLALVTARGFHRGKDLDNDFRTIFPAGIPT